MRCTRHPRLSSHLKEESLTCTMHLSVQDSPLLLQVRVFRGGNVWKGVLCVNLKLPPRTIQLRPSMHKVPAKVVEGAPSINLDAALSK